LGGFVEGGEGLGKAELAGEVLSVGYEQVGVFGALGEEGGVVVVGAGGVARFSENFSQHAGDGGIFWVGVVEFLDEGQGFRLVLCGEDRGQLRSEGGVIRGLLECGAEEGFGFRELIGGDEDVGEAGVGGSGFGIGGENAAVGGLGGFVVAGLLRQFGGEKGVVWGFGRELEGLEEVVGGLGGVVVAIDLSEGAPGAGFGERADFSGVEVGGEGELGAGVVEFVLTGEKEAEGDMGLKGFGVGFNGLAVEGDGVVEAVLGVGHVAGVEEGAGVSEVGGDVGSQFGRGGFPVGFGDGGFGFCDFRGEGLRSRGWRGSGCLGFRSGGGGLRMGRE